MASETEDLYIYTKGVMIYLSSLHCDSEGLIDLVETTATHDRREDFFAVTTRAKIKSSGYPIYFD